MVFKIMSRGGLIILLLLSFSCNTSYGKRVSPPKSKPEAESPKAQTTAAQTTAAQTANQENVSQVGVASSGVEFGKASYYNDSYQGKKTMSGEIYDRNKLSAAHPSLPFGTRCRITNLDNGKSVELHINDRCSGSNGRILDLSYEAAKQLDAITAGIIDAKLEIIQ